MYIRYMKQACIIFIQIDFKTNYYTQRDIITYRKEYALKEIKEFEQALSELEGKDNLED